MTTALRLTSPLFTLIVEDQGGKLWDEEGHVIAVLPVTHPGVKEQEGVVSRRHAWGEILANSLPKKAKVQILFASEKLEIICQEVPYLNSRESKEVAQRVIMAREAMEPQNMAYALDVDPRAAGGHQFWVAAQPVWEVQDCVRALLAARAEVVFATPWQRAFQRAAMDGRPTGFYLALEAGLGRLLLFNGGGLLLMRAFRLPEEIALEALNDSSSKLLTDIVGEEVGRTLHFVKQKHRSIAFDELDVVGLAELPVALVERLERGLHIAAKSLAPSVSEFILKGVAREKSRKGALNLVPVEIRNAQRLHFFYAVVWSAAAFVMAGLGLALLLLFRDEARLKQDVVLAEKARDLRRRLSEEGAQIRKQRLGLIRLRLAEHRQKAATEQLERLGVLLLDVPKGVTVEKIETMQVVGDAVLFRFEVTGTAITRRAFSVGPLAEYVARLGRHQGMKLDPLREISVSDRTPLSGQALGNTEKAVTQFKIQGVTP